MGLNTANTEYLQQVEDCEARSERLTDWEATFIDSLSNQLSKGRGLTERQSEILDRIWDKATTKG